MLTRRNLLQGTLAGLSVLDVSGRSAYAARSGTDYDVVILGAGVAGLAAAAELATMDSDLKVLVLEARDRIGGRVHSVHHERFDRDADLGAQYLLHSEGADWEVVDQLGLKVETLAGGGQTLFPGMGELARALFESSTGKVQLSSEVIQVHWRYGLVGVYYMNRGLEGAVTARRLISTLPVGVLQDAPELFKPALAPAKTEAMRLLPKRAAISVAMMFGAEHARLSGVEPQWIRESEDQRLRAFGTGFRDEVLLEAQYTGARAEALAGQSRKILQALTVRRFSEALESNPNPADALWESVVDWRDEEFSRGFGSVVLSTAQHLTLAESMGDTVFFAGEATADPAVAGTVHGAYMSGERAAREVALSLNIGRAAPDPNEALFELL